MSGTTKFINILKLLGIMIALSYTCASYEVFAQKGSLIVPADVLKNSPKTREQIWTASELWSQSVTEGLKFVDDAIVLDENLLIEDDAPGIGSIHAGLWETISYGTTLRKHLTITNWPIKKVVIAMMVYPVHPNEPMSGGMLEFRVNGHGPIIYEVHHVWTSVPVPVEYIRLGKNLIEVTVHGKDTKFRTPVSLYANYKYGSTASIPTTYASERSIDSGKTWTCQNLGASNNNSGEYPIRFKLQAFHKRGWLQTPVINLADSAIAGVLTFPSAVEFAQFKLDTILTAGSGWTVRVRSGKTHQPEIGGWTDWHMLAQDLLAEELKNRFIQLELSFQANSNNNSPELRGFSLSSQWRPLQPELLSEIFVTEAINRPLIRSSFPFQHEAPMFPALQEFRKKYQLDKLIEGSLNELEKIRRLRGWVAGLWDWYLPNTELIDMVKWDAREILSDNKNGGKSDKIGGYCLHYAIVFAQACQSFGIPARIVNLNYSVWGGHEVTEVWSREYEKWIMVDAQFDAMFYNRKNGVPCNALELHQVFLETYFPGKEIMDRDTWTIKDRDRRSVNMDPNYLPIAMETGGKAHSGRLSKAYTWWKFDLDTSAPGYSGGYGFFNTAEIRWLPRSNWLSQPTPMPITHGRTHWGWDGYIAWTDPQTPETSEHRNFASKESDMYGRLFTVDFSAETSQNGILVITMATDSPGFSHFELIVNGQRVVSLKHTYFWKLIPGISTIELRSLDVCGNRGAMSKLTVSYVPGNTSNDI